MMKKDYLKPKLKSVDFCAVSVLASSSTEPMSIKSGQDKLSVSDRERGEWGDLWSR